MSSFLPKMFSLLALAMSINACAMVAQEPIGSDNSGSPPSESANPPVILMPPPAEKACDPKTDLSGCKAILQVTHLAEPDRMTLAGISGYRAATIKMGVDGSRTAHFTSAMVTLFTVEDGAVASPAAFCASPCETSSSWVVHNVRLVDANTSELLMGPVAVPVAEDGKWPTVHFTGNVEMKPHEFREVAILVDVASPLPLDVNGKKFNAGLAVDSNETTIVRFLTETQRTGFEIIELKR